TASNRIWFMRCSFCSRPFVPETDTDIPFAIFSPLVFCHIEQGKTGIEVYNLGNRLHPAVKADLFAGREFLPGNAYQQLAIIAGYLPALQSNLLVVPGGKTSGKRGPRGFLIQRVPQGVIPSFTAKNGRCGFPYHRKCTTFPLPEVLAFRLFQPSISSAYSFKMSSTKEVDRFPPFSEEIPS